MTNAEEVQRYIDQVLDGTIVTGRLERLAVWRHVDDLKHAGERGYYFDPKKADKAILFAGFCNHYEGADWAGKPLTLRPEQKFIVWCLMGWRQAADGLRRFRHAQLEVARKWGKALSLDTMLPTPTGWTTMGEVQVGDILFDEGGQQCRVTNKTDVMFGRNCYKVTFSDGTSIIADEEHEWLTSTKRSGLPKKGGRHGGEFRNGVSSVYTHARTHFQSVKTTKEIKETLYTKGARPEVNHRISVCGPLDCDEVDLPVHPYVLGAWLGDGSSASSQITCAFSDKQIIDEIAECGLRVIENKRQSDTTGLWNVGSHGIRGKRADCLRKTLRQIGVLNNKHIPREYLRAAPHQRWALLQGLMDTDGCASRANRKCEFTTTSIKLADGFIELARSLGLRPVMYHGRATIYGKDCGEKYRISFSPAGGAKVFRLNRKQQLLDSRRSKVSNASRAIVSIEEVSSVPVQCIEVDSESHLYLAGEAMVPTHNSLFTSYLSCLLLFMDDPFEPGAQGYVCATKQGQAVPVWKGAQKMIEKSPFLKERAKITPSQYKIELPESDSIFRPLSADKTPDGFNAHFIIRDEEHAWREHHRGQAETLNSGFGARSQPLSVTITTYGKEGDSVIWLENHGYAVQCLESVITGEIVNDTWFAFIAALDYPQEKPCFRCKGDNCPWCGGDGIIKPDDLFDERVWRKANPGIGLGAGFTPRLERMRDSARKAKNGIEADEFIQKNLNVMVSSRNKAITPESIIASRGELSDFAGVTGHGGVDMARSEDFAAAAMVFPFLEVDDDGEAFIRYETVTRSWTVQNRTRDLQTSQIERWIEEGHLLACGGSAVDVLEVKDAILDWHNTHTIRTWAYDKTFAVLLAQILETEGLEMFAFGQSHKFYTAPIVELLKCIGKTRVVNGVEVPLFKHNGNPCFEWQAGNLVVDRNVRDEQMPVKSQKVNKIDVMVAVLMALSECLYHQDESVDGYYLKNSLALGSSE